MSGIVVFGILLILLIIGLILCLLAVQMMKMG